MCLRRAPEKYIAGAALDRAVLQCNPAENKLKWNVGGTEADALRKGRTHDGRHTKLVTEQTQLPPPSEREMKREAGDVRSSLDMKKKIKKSNYTELWWTLNKPWDMLVFGMHILWHEITTWRYKSTILPSLKQEHTETEENIYNSHSRELFHRKKQSFKFFLFCFYVSYDILFFIFHFAYSSSLARELYYTAFHNDLDLVSSKFLATSAPTDTPHQ
jgi:hypothetical protein